MVDIYDPRGPAMQPATAAKVDNYFKYQVSIEL
jgi:hypothetical protein